MVLDEEYGQFTNIDINDEIFKLKDKNKHINRFIKKEPRIVYYELNNHDYIFNPDYYYSDEEIFNQEKCAINNQDKNKATITLFDIGKHWIMYLGILFTGVYSVYFIFTL